MSYSSMSHTSWWSAQNDNNWTHALITKKSEWSYKDIRYNIIQQALRVAYDQTHDQTTISQAHKVSHTSTQSKSSTKSKRDKKQDTLSRSLWSIHISPPLATSYQKVQICIVLCISQAWSPWGGVEMTPRTKASVDVAGAAGVAAGGGTEAVAAGVDVVALV